MHADAVCKARKQGASQIFALLRCLGRDFHSSRAASYDALILIMTCSYELFLAVAALQRRSFSCIRLNEITAALEANRLSEVPHVRFAHIDDEFELPAGSHASLLHFFVVLQEEPNARHASPACSCQ